MGRKEKTPHGHRRQGQHPQKGGKLVQLRGHQHQQAARHHDETDGPANGLEEPALVSKGEVVILGQGLVVHLKDLQKMPEHKRGGQKEGRHQHVKGAGIGKPVVVKSQHVLQPAQKHAKGARAAHIAADLQSFLSHNHKPVS